MSNTADDSTRKIYIGNAKEKTRPNGDKYIVGSICIDDINNLAPEHIAVAKNKKRYVKIVINPFRDGVNRYDNTHSVAVDTFKPDKDHADKHE